MRMGVREARTLVVVVALRSTLLGSPGLGEAAQKMWRHSLLTASATQEIASEIPPWETAGFLAGLLHELGNLVVLAFIVSSSAVPRMTRRVYLTGAQRIIQGYGGAGCQNKINSSSDQLKLDQLLTF